MKHWKIILPVFVCFVAITIVIAVVVTQHNKKVLNIGASLRESAQNTSESMIETNKDMVGDTTTIENAGVGLENVPVEEASDKEDPQNINEGMGTESSGAAVDQEEMESAIQEAATNSIDMGIDVSVHQGKIDWKKVADSGIKFVMVRVGYRTIVDGTLTEDPNARYNMKNAAANGIGVGVYFYSTAITTDEARAEADFVANIIKDYTISYPVAYDCEGFRSDKSRQKGLSASDRTDIACAFCKAIADKGYTPLFYGSKNDLSDGSWKTSTIDKYYKVWVAQYPSKPYPETSKTSYTGKHVMWQYTNKGSVSGISGNVDLNISYLNVPVQKPSSDSPSTGTTVDTGASGSGSGSIGDIGTTVDSSSEEPAGPTITMKFKDCDETVTPKDAVNLRSTPDQGSNDNVVVKISNGQNVRRTGISTSGWSRVEYEGQILYCVSSYVIAFTDCDETVTPISEVNLRSTPNQGSNDNVVIKISNGQNMKRTGISGEDWSRVEYEGQILYCKSSLILVVE